MAVAADRDGMLSVHCAALVTAGNAPSGPLFTPGEAGVVRVTLPPGWRVILGVLAEQLRDRLARLPDINSPDANSPDINRADKLPGGTPDTADEDGAGDTNAALAALSRTLSETSVEQMLATRNQPELSIADVDAWLWALNDIRMMLDDELSAYRAEALNDERTPGALSAAFTALLFNELAAAAGDGARR